MDVIINGYFRGNYLIFDKIEVPNYRVIIAEMGQICNQESEVTGGYLIPVTGSESKGSHQLFSCSKGIGLSFQHPRYRRCYRSKKRI